MNTLFSFGNVLINTIKKKSRYGLVFIVLIVVISSIELKTARTIAMNLPNDGNLALSNISYNSDVPLVSYDINNQKESITSIVSAPVVQIAFYPPDSANALLLDSVETDLPQGTTIASIKNKVDALAQDGVAVISEATRYRGHLDPNAPEHINYTIIDSIDYLEPIPPGWTLPSSFSPEALQLSKGMPFLQELEIAQGAHYPHYRQILEGLNICNYVDVMGVKEIWMYGYHTAEIAPAESKMSSRYGDISNSYRDEGLPAEFRLPRCDNSYVLYNFNYGRDLDTNIHNRHHQLEAILGYLDDTIFWNDFSESVGPGDVHDYLSSCGNGHYTPNWQTNADEYLYNLANYRENNCDTWHPDDSQTTYVGNNCSQWGCTEVGYHSWFMHNMPGYQNGIEYQGCMMRNWWEAMYDFNTYVDQGQSLIEECTPGYYKLTVTKSGTGSGTVTSNPAGVVCYPDCVEWYAPNTTVTLTAAPSGFSSFSGWSGGGCTGTGTCTITMSQARTVTAEFTDDIPSSNLLLVDDDDNDPDVRTYYTDTLATLGLSYDVWDTANSDSEPDAPFLANYDIVIWFTGDEYGGFAGPGSTGEAALSSWLDNSNCLFLSSQDYHFDRSQTSFMSTYLGVSSVNNDVGDYTSVDGQGSVFSGLGPYNLTYPVVDYSDDISPDGTAELAFIGNNSWGGAILKYNGTYRTTFWAFPFEALETSDNRTEAMGQFIDWCHSGYITGMVTDEEVEGYLADEVSVRAISSDNQIQDSSILFEAGTYMLNVPPGTYRVQFRSNYGVYLNEYFDNVLDYNSATVINVTPGSTTSGIDAALIDAAYIYGQIFSEADGQDLEGIDACAFTQSGADWVQVNCGINFYHSTGDIYYAIPLPAGTYRVGFSDPNGLYQTEYYDDVGNIESAVDLYLPAAGDKQFNIDAALAFNYGGVPKDDIFWYAAGPNADYLAKSNGNGTFTFQAKPVGGTYTPLVGNFAGSATTDIFWYAPGSPPDYLWTATGGGSFTETALSVSGTYEPLLGDYNNDGFTDFFWYAAGPNADWLALSNGSGGFNYTPKTVNGTYTPLVGNFAGSAADDIFWYAPGAPLDYLWTATGSGSFTEAAISVSGTYEPLLGDFDNNGFTDFFWYAPGPNADWVALSNGSGGFTYTAKPVGGTYTPLVGNFAGSAAADIFWYAPGAPLDYLWTATGGGSFSETGLSVSGTYEAILGDYNRDGYTDFFWYVAGPGADWIALSNGNGTFAYTQQAIGGTYTPFVGDFDGSAAAVQVPVNLSPERIPKRIDKR